MVRQEKLSHKIADIEKLLKKYKLNLAFVNQRMKNNVVKIVQSQREMISARTHKENFGKICQQIGTMVRGSDYR